jgi:hypothetical protein
MKKKMMKKMMKMKRKKEEEESEHEVTRLALNSVVKDFLKKRGS